MGKSNTGSRWRASGPIDSKHIEKFLGSTQQYEKMKPSENKL